MKFSIVITTYNRIALLKRAIDTALNQTVPCEVVIADDCSTDGTEEYVRELAASLAQKGDHRIIYHQNSTNQGHSASMNAGVAVASGDWIKPLDDDDYLAPNCIEEIVNAIDVYQDQKGENSASKVVICSCQSAQVDPEENELSRTRITGPGKVFYIPQEDIHYGMLLEQVPFGTPVQVAYEKDAFIKSGGWDSSLDANCDDIDSWIRIAQFGDALFINECLAYRTIWPGAYNYKFSFQKRLDTNILMKEKIYQFVNQKHSLQIPSLQAIRDYLKLHWSLVALKQAQVLKAITLASVSVFSPCGWKLLLKSISHRKQQLSNFKDSLLSSADCEENIQRIILID